MKKYLLLMATVFGVGVWADLARGRWPDYFSPFSAAIGMLMAYVCADIFLPQMTKPRRRRIVVLLWSVAFVACAHTLPILLAGLVQIPRVGVQFLPDVLAGAWYTLRQAWVPVMVGGSVLYFGLRNYSGHPFFQRETRYSFPLRGKE